VPGRLLVTVSIRRLVDLLDPLHADPWSVGVLPPAPVLAALRDGRLRAQNPCWHERLGSATAHAERIAWLIHHGWDGGLDLPHLEVDEYGGVGLHDGHHRLYVLALLDIDGPITIELSGFLDIAETLLGIVIA
jgi:hypothetical protein